MRILSLSTFAFVVASLSTTTVMADDWCHTRFQSSDGYAISLDYQIHGSPSKSGAYRADPIWVNIAAPDQSRLSDVSVVLTDVAAHHNEASNQIIDLTLQSADSGRRFTGDAFLSTSANETQTLRVQVGGRWLENPATGTEVFAFDMGYALWAIPSQCLFD